MTLVSVNGIFPLQFEKHLRECSYKNDYWILFDQKKQKAYWRDTSFSVTEFTQDIISVFYYVRAAFPKQGKDLILDTHTDKKNYPLIVKYLGKEDIKVPAGVFHCVVVEPALKGEGFFKQKGTLKVWLTDDEKHIPVCMKSKIFAIGSVSANLISYSEK
jgi:hypothetical protein